MTPLEGTGRVAHVDQHANGAGSGLQFAREFELLARQGIEAEQDPGHVAAWPGIARHEPKRYWITQGDGNDWRAGHNLSDSQGGRRGCSHHEIRLPQSQLASESF